jgi:hypothetical protein
MAFARRARAQSNKCVRDVSASHHRTPRRLSLFALARARQQICSLVEPAEAIERLRQVVWAIEQGALRRFEIPLALNIALKKIREGLWTRPNRMPPNWSRLSAPTETCNAA